MADQLQIKKTHQNLLMERKKAIEAKFNVKIHPLMSFTPKKDSKNGSNGSVHRESCINTLVGGDSDIAALKKYVQEVFVQPEIIDIVSYHHDLGAIFQNPVWINIFEEFYGVCITVEPDCELNISGTESSVLSTVAAFEDLITQYREGKDTLVLNNERSLAPKLVIALNGCKGVNISANTFESIPNNVISLLLSLLEKAYKESFPVFDDPELLDDSVVILDPPEKKTAEVSVIVLDLPSDSDGDSKQQLESLSSQKIKRKKRKKAHERNLKKRRNRAPESVNSLHMPDHSELQNGGLHCPKMENSVNESNLPKIENSSFIPLSLDGANDNSSTSKSPPEHSGQFSGEVKVAKEEVEVISEIIPKEPRQLRPIIIDGSNVAFYSTRGRREDFSWNRIDICMKYFLNRGHNVMVFLPQYRLPVCYEKSGNEEHIKTLETKQQIIFTPSWKAEGRRITCYDDRFIVDFATRKGGIVVSNDQYRDLINENSDYAKTIKERLLKYVFVGDELMIPADPLGKNGPHLDEFLCFPPEK